MCPFECGICKGDELFNEPDHCCDCDDSGGICFPGESTLNLQSGKSVKMSELQVGDRVQTGKKSVKIAELQVGDRVQTGKNYVKMFDRKVSTNR